MTASARVLVLTLTLTLTLALLALAGCRRDRVDPKVLVAPDPPQGDDGRALRRAGKTRAGDYARDGVLARPPRGALPADAAPKPAPATAPAEPVYLTLGGVVAEVNGQPVYADALVRDVAPALRGPAQRLDARAFRELAEDELAKGLQQRVRDELVFAAANRSASPDDLALARNLTFRQGEELVTAAGGSEAAARQRMADEGRDWDEHFRDAYRANLVGVYYQKRVFPRASVSVDELRQHYDRVRAERYATPAQVSFEFVEVRDRIHGGAEGSRARAEEARRAVAAGGSLETAAAELNKGPGQAGRPIKVGPIGRGAFRGAELEAAAWETDVNDVTPVVRFGDAHYFARVTAKNPEQVRPFSEPLVQDELTAELRQRKIAELQREQADQLARDAVVRSDPAMLRPAVEMAMQLYETWRGGTAGAATR